MKKILMVLAGLCICLTACGKEQPAVEGNSGSVWDCVEYDNLDDMNAAAGTNIVNEGVDGISEEWFGVISGSIAQYKFKIGEEDWCIRASRDVDNDISGLYYDSIKFEKDQTSFFYVDEVYMCRFFNSGVQYVISLNNTDDISTTYFDSVANQFMTSITGVKSGYEVEIIEDGDTVINKTTLYLDDGTQMLMETLYTFENDKMVSIINKLTFESEEAAKEYLDSIVEYGQSIDDVVQEGACLTYDNSANLDMYEDDTKESFVKQLKEMYNQ